MRSGRITEEVIRMIKIAELYSVWVPTWGFSPEALEELRVILVGALGPEVHPDFGNFEDCASGQLGGIEILYLDIPTNVPLIGDVPEYLRRFVTPEISGLRAEVDQKWSILRHGVESWLAPENASQFTSAVHAGAYPTWMPVWEAQEVAEMGFGPLEAILEGPSWWSTETIHGGGLTMLQEAARVGNRPLCEFLLAEGADPLARAGRNLLFATDAPGELHLTKGGEKLPSALAAQKGHGELAAFLRKQEEAVKD